MKFFRKIIDERQELEMMRVERVGFWIMFFGLVFAITLQVFVFDVEVAHIAGECIVLMLGVGWSLIGYIRRGSWDYFTKPGMKSYVIYSAASSIVFGLVAPLARFFRQGASFMDCLLFFAINTAILFPILFLSMWLLGSVTKRQQNKLQQECEEE